MSLAIELNKISKSFPGVKANDDISFSVNEGSIHAIVGENGAGKSTLMKILYGMQNPMKVKLQFLIKSKNFPHLKTLYHLELEWFTSISCLLTISQY